MKLKVIIKTNVSNSNLNNAKEKFWSSVIGEANSDTDTKISSPVVIGESYLSRKFPKKLKDKIISELDSQIRAIEQNILGREYWNFFEELRFRGPIIEKNENINEYYRAISTSIQENTELRKTLLTNNEKYNQLLEKRILAAQFIFSTSNFKYASLGFDLNIEPAQSIISFFDNNFEYLEVFFNCYVADIFNEEFNSNNSIAMDYSVSLDTNLKPAIIQAMGRQANSNESNLRGKSKLDQAKWYWIVANGSLIIPVLISIYLIYNYSDKLNKVEKIQDQKLNTIFEQQDKLISHYQEEIKRLDDLELKLLSASKKDSIVKK